MAGVRKKPKKGSGKYQGWFADAVGKAHLLHRYKEPRGNPADR